MSQDRSPETPWAPDMERNHGGGGPCTGQRREGEGTCLTRPLAHLNRARGPGSGARPGSGRGWNSSRLLAPCCVGAGTAGHPVTASARDEAPPPPPGPWRASATTTPRLGPRGAPRGQANSSGSSNAAAPGWADLSCRRESKTPPCKSIPQRKPDFPALVPHYHSAGIPGHLITANSLNAAPRIQQTARDASPQARPAH